MKPGALFLGLTLVVAGCAQLGMAPPPSALSTPMASSEVEWARQSGSNTVNGTASIRSGAELHTCAGQSANLIPDSPYARSRMSAIFGSTEKGMRAASLQPVKFERDDQVYVGSLRNTRCDASGSFSFQRVPDGIWFVTSSVKWQGASQIEGGSMMRRIDVRGGKLVKVSLP